MSISIYNPINIAPATLSIGGVPLSNCSFASYTGTTPASAGYALPYTVPSGRRAILVANSASLGNNNNGNSSLLYPNAGPGAGYGTNTGVSLNLSTTPIVCSLTQVTAGGANGTFTGTITGGGSNAYANSLVTTSGFTHANNNGTFLCSASTATQLTLGGPTNSSFTSETNTGSASIVQFYGGGFFSNGSPSGNLYVMEAGESPALVCSGTTPSSTLNADSYTLSILEFDNTSGLRTTKILAFSTSGDVYTCPAGKTAMTLSNGQFLFLPQNPSGVQTNIVTGLTGQTYSMYYIPSGGSAKAAYLIGTSTSSYSPGNPVSLTAGDVIQVSVTGASGVFPIWVTVVELT